MTNDGPTEGQGSTAEFLDDGAVSPEVARRFLGVSKTSFYAAMDRGEIPYAKIGRSRRIPKRALREFLARNLRGGWAK